MKSLRCPAEPVEPEDKGPAVPAGVDPELLAKILSKSGDGSFADESGKEYKDVRENVRSVGFGKNPKGDRSFFMFYSALDILTIALEITLTDFEDC